MQTIRGRNNADTHLKNPGWIFVCDAPHKMGQGVDKSENKTPASVQSESSARGLGANEMALPTVAPRRVFLVISNFEAEHCAGLLSTAVNFPTIDDHLLEDQSEIVDAYERTEENGGREFNRLRFCPRLYTFAAITRLSMSEVFLQRVCYAQRIPISLHVFSGSIHCDDALLAMFQHYLALLPRPPEIGDDHDAEDEEPFEKQKRIGTAVALRAWDKLYDGNMIERDGFVPVDVRRQAVELLLASCMVKTPDTSGASVARTRATNFFGENLREMLVSPLVSKSPVRFLRDFYNNARHLDGDLAMSAVGRLLGAAELGGLAKE